MMKTIKKYSNRRLYDTDQSKYVTLEELAALIRQGDDVEVIDAKSGEDLTQGVLAQIVVESRGAARLLPVPLLTEMIRMEEDALAEFMTLYMGWALDVFFQVKKGFRDINPYQLLGGNLPFSPGQALGRLFSQRAPWSGEHDRSGQARHQRSPTPPPTETASEPPADQGQGPPADKLASGADIDTLRREIQRLNERLDDMSEDG